MAVISVPGPTAVTTCKFCQGTMVRAEGGIPGSEKTRVKCTSCGTRGLYDPKTGDVSHIELPEK